MNRSHLSLSWSVYWNMIRGHLRSFFSLLTFLSSCVVYYSCQYHFIIHMRLPPNVLIFPHLPVVFAVSTAVCRKSTREGRMMMKHKKRDESEMWQSEKNVKKREHEKTNENQTRLDADDYYFWWWWRMRREKREKPTKCEVIDMPLILSPSFFN